MFRGDRLKIHAACAGDSMQVIRDALLSQLQKDRLRQEIILAELAKIERSMALHSAAAAERTSPAPFDFDEQFKTHGTGAVGPESHVGVGKANDRKKEDRVRRCKGKRSKERHVKEDGLDSESSKASFSTCKTAGDDEDEPQETSEVRSLPYLPCNMFHLLLPHTLPLLQNVSISNTGKCQNS